MSDNTCHCGAPAPWLLRIIKPRAEYATASWASCDAHIAEAARQLTARHDMTGKLLHLRNEEGTFPVMSSDPLARLQHHGGDQYPGTVSDTSRDHYPGRVS